MTVDQNRDPVSFTANPRSPAPPWLPPKADLDWLRNEPAAAAQPRESDLVQTLRGWPRVFPGI